MKKITLALLSTLLTSLLMAEESEIDLGKSIKEGHYKIVPLVSSNPTR